MDYRNREKLLQMREEDQLPQNLNIMVERAELEMKRLGCSGLTVRDLVILSAVVPIVQGMPLVHTSDVSEKLKSFDDGADVRVSYKGKDCQGTVTGIFGKRYKVQIDGEKGYRIIEANSLEAI